MLTQKFNKTLIEGSHKTKPGRGPHIISLLSMYSKNSSCVLFKYSLNQIIHCTYCNAFGEITIFLMKSPNIKTFTLGTTLQITVILLKKMLTQKLLSNLGFLSSDPEVDVSLIVSIPPMLH